VEQRSRQPRRADRDERILTLPSWAWDNAQAVEERQDDRDTVRVFLDEHVEVDELQ